MAKGLHSADSSTKVATTLQRDTTSLHFLPNKVTTPLLFLQSKDISHEYAVYIQIPATQCKDNIQLMFIPKYRLFCKDTLANLHFLPNKEIT